jgi:hypothetical protein
MKNTSKKKNKIVDYFTELEIRLKNSNAMGMTDVNIQAEAFCAKILNILYSEDSLELIWMEKIKKNNEVFDLGDEKSKIVYQVTYRKDVVEKITETIDKFATLDCFKQGTYDDLRFIILNHKELSKTELKNIKKRYSVHNLKFDDKSQILNVNGMLKLANTLNDEKTKQLLRVFKREFKGSLRSRIRIRFNFFLSFSV